tara:strand:+ start:33 stop:689 length:657 start_codon:yes stop_codon:yes gene_type:complete
VNRWINKDTEVYCSFAETAGNTGCQMMNSAFFYYGLNKIYKSFSVSNIEHAIQAVKTLDIRGFAITMPFKIQVIDFVDEFDENVIKIGASNTVINNDGVLKAYNTDYLAAKTILSGFNRSKLYILGNGGYSKAVQEAAKSLNYDPIVVTRDRNSKVHWDNINELEEDSIIYNCTPIENLSVRAKNFIDCIVTTETGKKLATLQASHQFKLYTDLEFPF